MSSVDTPFNVGSWLGPPRLSTSCGVQMLNKKVCVMWLWRLLDTVNAWLHSLHFFKWDILFFRHYSAYTVLNTTWKHALFTSQLQDTEVFLTIGWSVSGVTYKGRRLRELLHSVQSYVGWVTTPVAWLLQSKWWGNIILMSQKEEQWKLHYISSIEQCHKECKWCQFTPIVPKHNYSLNTYRNTYKYLFQ